jgi:hypothetical protein
MTSAIFDLPEQSTFGYDHNYSAWAPNSQVLLCKVPWNASYRDGVYMDGGQAAMNTYLETRPTTERLTITDAVYLKMGQPIDLDIPFNVANKMNYIRVHNPAQPITSPGGSDVDAYLYYFIANVEYIAPNTTRFVVQLDVFQTYVYSTTFGQVFLERGHKGIAASNAFDEFGRAFLNIPEGMDIGGEYVIMHNWSHSIASARGGLGYGILIMSNVALNSPNAGDVNNAGFINASGSMMENLPSAASIYLVDAGDFLTVMDSLKDKPWITAGIVSITAIPNDAIERYELITGDVTIPDVPAGMVKDIMVGSAVDQALDFDDNFRDTIMSFVPEQYRHLKKLLTFPYCALEFTTYSGQPVILKPEAWDSSGAVFNEVPHLVPGSAKIVFYPEGYNRRTGATAQVDSLGTKNDAGEFLDVATSISNFPQFSILNNSYVAFMASNRNSIAFQHHSADWSQQRAMTGNQLSFDQASAGMGLTEELNRLNVNAATQSTSLANQTAGYQALQGAGNSVVGAIQGKDPIGGAMGVLNAGVGFAISQNQNNQSLNISTNLQNAATNANVSNAGYMADTNLQYASYAAKGDYQNAIAGITAKVQDAKLLQPTTSGQVGGDTFNLAKYQWGVDLKVKMLQRSAMNQVCGYWMRFGYQMNIWTTMPADFHCMTHFTYWKLRETYIVSSNCPEVFKETIRGIFEKGVTVWRNPNDIGVVAMTSNLPVEGITL